MHIRVTKRNLGKILIDKTIQTGKYTKVINITLRLKTIDQNEHVKMDMYAIDGQGRTHLKITYSFT